MESQQTCKNEKKDDKKMMKRKEVIRRYEKKTNGNKERKQKETNVKASYDCRLEKQFTNDLPPLVASTWLQMASVGRRLAAVCLPVGRRFAPDCPPVGSS